MSAPATEFDQAHAAYFASVGTPAEPAARQALKDTIEAEPPRWIGIYRGPLSGLVPANIQPVTK